MVAKETTENQARAIGALNVIVLLSQTEALSQGRLSKKQHRKMEGRKRAVENQRHKFGKLLLRAKPQHLTTLALLCKVKAKLTFSYRYLHMLCKVLTAEKKDKGSGVFCVKVSENLETVAVSHYKVKLESELCKVSDLGQETLGKPRRWLLWDRKNFWRCQTPFFELEKHSILFDSRTNRFAVVNLQATEKKIFWVSKLSLPFQLALCQQAFTELSNHVTFKLALVWLKLENQARKVVSFPAKQKVFDKIPVKLLLDKQTLFFAGLEENETANQIVEAFSQLVLSVDSANRKLSISPRCIGTGVQNESKPKSETTFKASIKPRRRKGVAVFECDRNGVAKIEKSYSAPEARNRFEALSDPELESRVESALERDDDDHGEARELLHACFKRANEHIHLEGNFEIDGCTFDLNEPIGTHSLLGKTVLVNEAVLKNAATKCVENFNRKVEEEKPVPREQRFSLRSKVKTQAQKDPNRSFLLSHAAQSRSMRFLFGKAVLSLSALSSCVSIALKSHFGKVSRESIWAIEKFSMELQERDDDDSESLFDPHNTESSTNLALQNFRLFVANHCVKQAHVFRARNHLHFKAGNDNKTIRQHLREYLVDQTNIANALAGANPKAEIAQEDSECEASSRLPRVVFPQEGTKLVLVERARSVLKRVRFFLESRFSVQANLEAIHEDGIKKICGEPPNPEGGQRDGAAASQGEEEEAEEEDHEDSMQIDSEVENLHALLDLRKGNVHFMANGKEEITVEPLPDERIDRMSENHASPDRAQDWLQFLSGLFEQDHTEATGTRASRHQRVKQLSPLLQKSKNGLVFVGEITVKKGMQSFQKLISRFTWLLVKIYTSTRLCTVESITSSIDSIFRDSIRISGPVLLPKQEIDIFSPSALKQLRAGIFNKWFFRTATLDSLLMWMKNDPEVLGRIPGARFSLTERLLSGQDLNALSLELKANVPRQQLQKQPLKTSRFLLQGTRDGVFFASDVGDGPRKAFVNLKSKRPISNGKGKRRKVSKSDWSDLVQREEGKLYKISKLRICTLESNQNSESRRLLSEREILLSGNAELLVHGKCKQLDYCGTTFEFQHRLLLDESDSQEILNHSPLVATMTFCARFPEDMKREELWRNVNRSELRREMKQEIRAIRGEVTPTPQNRFLSEGPSAEDFEPKEAGTTTWPPPPEGKAAEVYDFDEWFASEKVQNWVFQTMKSRGVETEATIEKTIKRYKRTTGTVGRSKFRAALKYASIVATLFWGDYVRYMATGSDSDLFCSDDFFIAPWDKIDSSNGSFSWNSRNIEMRSLGSRANQRFKNVFGGTAFENAYIIGQDPGLDVLLSMITRTACFAAGRRLAETLHRIYMLCHARLQSEMDTLKNKLKENKEQEGNQEAREQTEKQIAHLQESMRRKLAAARRKRRGVFEDITEFVKAAGTHVVAPELDVLSLSRKKAGGFGSHFNHKMRLNAPKEFARLQEKRLTEGFRKPTSMILDADETCSSKLNRGSGMINRTLGGSKTNKCNFSARLARLQGKQQPPAFERDFGAGTSVTTFAFTKPVPSDDPEHNKASAAWAKRVHRLRDKLNHIEFTNAKNAAKQKQDEQQLKPNNRSDSGVDWRVRSP